MQLTSKFNKGFRFLLCVIDSFCKYVWVVPLKDKKGLTIANAFQEILDDSNGKSVVAERFIRTLKIKIYEYMTAISKSVYIDQLDNIVNEYNNTYHRTIKMKPIDVRDNTYIDFKK